MSALKHEILVSCHDAPTAGHFCVFKTYEKLRSKYYWRKMYSDVDHWVKPCVHCAMKKTPRTTAKAPLLPIPVEGPFDRVAVDCVGLLSRCIFLTRWSEAFAVPCIKAPVIANLFINQIMTRHDAPRTLLFDKVGTSSPSLSLRYVAS